MALTKTTTQTETVDYPAPNDPDRVVNPDDPDADDVGRPDLPEDTEQTPNPEEPE